MSCSSRWGCCGAEFGAAQAAQERYGPFGTGIFQRLLIGGQMAIPPYQRIGLSAHALDARVGPLTGRRQRNWPGARDDVLVNVGNPVWPHGGPCRVITLGDY